MEKKLYRDEYHKKVGGVCAGLAEYFNVDVSVVRAIFVIGMLVKGVGLIPYIVLWSVLPKRPYPTSGFAKQPPFTTGYTPPFNPNVDYTVPQPPVFDQTGVFNPPKRSNASVIFGAVLIVLGTLFLIDELNIIPDVDFEDVWPIILVTIGLGLIFSGQKKQPWEKDEWHKTTSAAAAADESLKADVTKTEDNNTENPTTI